MEDEDNWDCWRLVKDILRRKHIDMDREAG